MYRYPFLILAVRLFSLMKFGGIKLKGIFMYFYLSNGVAR